MRSRSLLVAASALLVSLLVWEGFLRLFVVRPVAYRHQPGLGWMPEPLATGLHTEEGRGVCAYNELGFRGPSVSPRAPGELRIACLGDSFTEGQQMDIDDTFPARLEQGLGARLSSLLADGAEARRVRVFNGGRGATSPAYLVGLSAGYLAAFDPDWVVALVRDASWDATLAQHSESELRYQVEDGRIRLVTSFRWDRTSRLRRALLGSPLRHLALARQATTRLAELAKRDAEPGAARALASAGSASGEGTVTPERELAMDFTLRELASRYPHVLVVHIPTATGVGLEPPSALESRLGELAERSGLAFLPLRPRLEADLAGTGKVPYGFANTLPWTGHPNAEGHRVIAAALVDFFAPRRPPASR